MKKLVQFTCIFFLIFMCSMKTQGEERYEDSMTADFSDPEKPGVLKVVSGSEDVTVTGYDGNKAIIKTKSEIENLANLPEKEKAKGLKRISGTSFNVVDVEDENTVVISRSFKNDIDLFIQTPFKISLIIGGGDTGSLIGSNIVKKTSVKMNIFSTWIPPFGGKIGGKLAGNIDVTNVAG